MLTLRVNCHHATNSAGQQVILSDYRLSMATENPFDLFAYFIKRANQDVMTRRYLPQVRTGKFMLNFE